MHFPIVDRLLLRIYKIPVRVAVCCWHEPKREDRFRKLIPNVSAIFRYLSVLALARCNLASRAASRKIRTCTQVEGSRLCSEALTEVRSAVFAVYKHRSSGFALV